MYLDSAKKYPFCPGCSHHTVLDAIGSALGKTGADPRRTVLVSDIGCVGLSDKHFLVHTFHGLHGRSFTYACGIKLANPELLVFVLVGDGGCGIGGHHLINAARRNIGVKVLCFNNLNFGMTGGQHSVTTPVGGKTPTTPGGSLERPFDLADLVAAAGGSYVARAKATEKGLDDVIVKAFRHNGFAFVDIWEICTAYYMPANEFRKSAMDSLMEQYGFTVGTLREEKLPEYAAALRGNMAPKGALASKGIEPAYKHSLKKDEFGIVMAGSAGMKVLSAASRFGRAAIACGLWVTQKDDYPVTVQSGHSVAEIKIARERIDYLSVDSPDAVIVLSQDGLNEARDTISKMQKDAVVYFAKGLTLPETRARVCELDFTGVDKTATATFALARLLKEQSLFLSDALRAEIEKIGNEKVRTLLLMAITRAQ